MTYKFTCALCNKQFVKMKSLNHHIDVHIGPTLLKCPSCDECFAHKRNLQRHLVMHTGEKPFQCLACNKGFFTKGVLTQHQIVHSGKLFKCSGPFCFKTFYDEKSLARHMLVHTPRIHKETSVNDSNQTKEYVRITKIDDHHVVPVIGDIRKNCFRCYRLEKQQRQAKCKCATCNRHFCFNKLRNCLLDDHPLSSS